MVLLEQKGKEKKKQTTLSPSSLNSTYCTYICNEFFIIFIVLGSFVCVLQVYGLYVRSGGGACAAVSTVCWYVMTTMAMHKMQNAKWKSRGLLEVEMEVKGRRTRQYYSTNGKDALLELIMGNYQSVLKRSMASMLALSMLLSCSNSLSSGRGGLLRISRSSSRGIRMASMSTFSATGSMDSSQYHFLSKVDRHMNNDHKFSPLTT